MAQTFIVSDESRNTHGFVILTAGIDYADFARNPIMYYMHERFNGVIGRWENIRVEGTQLLMDAVFDDSTALGKQVKAQVENGFLRCASIGIEQPEYREINGVQTCVKCRLREVSIVDIPANRSAVKLFNQQGCEVFTLADCMGKSADPLRKTIKASLGLSDRADDAEILSALEMRLNEPKMPENEVSRAVRLGLIDESDREEYMAMACADMDAFNAVIERKEARAKANFEAVLLKACRSGRIDAPSRGVFVELAKHSGYALCERLLSTLPKRASIVDQINQGDNSREGWGLAEYRKHAPEELKNNPALYESLLVKEGRLKPLDGSTVEYYRKYHPEYLASHPKEYKRAMEEKAIQDKAEKKRF